MPEAVACPRAGDFAGATMVPILGQQVNRPHGVALFRCLHFCAGPGRRPPASCHRAQPARRHRRRPRRSRRCWSAQIQAASRCPLHVAPPHSRHRRGHAESGQMPRHTDGAGPRRSTPGRRDRPQRRAQGRIPLPRSSSTTTRSNTPGHLNRRPDPRIQPSVLGPQPAHSHPVPDGGSVRAGPSRGPGSGRQGRPNRDDQRTDRYPPAESSAAC